MTETNQTGDTGISYMTLRTYLAGQALAGLCANARMAQEAEQISKTRLVPNEYAKVSVVLADALLAELAKEKTP